MGDERPETLLKSALERIVYFEARAGQLQTELAAAREEAERLKRELAVAAQREISVRREVAELQVRLERSHAEKQELGRVHDALRQERTQLMGKLLEASRIQTSSRDGEDADLGLDLASFISELRSEALMLGQPYGQRVAAQQQASVAPAPSAPTALRVVAADA